MTYEACRLAPEVSDFPVGALADAEYIDLQSTAGNSIPEIRLEGNDSTLPLPSLKVDIFNLMDGRKWYGLEGTPVNYLLAEQSTEPLANGLEIKPGDSAIDPAQVVIDFEEKPDYTSGDIRKLNIALWLGGLSARSIDDDTQKVRKLSRRSDVGKVMTGAVLVADAVFVDGFLGTQAGNLGELGAVATCFGYDKYLSNRMQARQNRAIVKNTGRAIKLAKMMPVFQAI